MKRYVGMVIAVLYFVIGFGCAANVPPNTSPEGKMAVQALKVVEGLRATLPTIKDLVCRRDVPSVTCISPADADKVAANIDKAADYAIQLSAVLAAVDKTTSVDEKLTGTAKARQMLTSIQYLLSEAAVSPANEPARTQLVKLFSNLTALLFAVTP